MFNSYIYFNSVDGRILSEMHSSVANWLEYRCKKKKQTGLKTTDMFLFLKKDISLAPDRFPIFKKDIRCLFFKKKKMSGAGLGQPSTLIKYI